MPKLTVREDNSEQIKQPSEESGSVKDSQGRVIKIRELDAVQEARIFCAAGAEFAVNMPYMNMYVFPASKVEEIDGEKYSVPKNEIQINAMLSILGKSGLKAVQDFMFKNVGNENANAADETAAKN